ncbi:tetratricopeptide repeat protein [Muricauda sp. DJ-13]|uniref:Tetratricopeptide repeat protein n=1 Tax=Croceivirga thetidis TaxID=2721623 RepID=A0ABX1GRJ9_9FLAO|nr:tetratricopeptide repeat protein [Croceivirga thetidis]
MKRLIFIAVLFVTTIGVSQNDAYFAKATELYNKGEFENALNYYDRILDNGKHSAELYFNMGNAHYKLENIGPSIFYYEKALLLKPNDPEILNNLGYAQNMRLDAIEELPKTAMGKLYESIIKLFNFNQWSYLAVLFMILFVLAYIAYYLLNLAFRKRLFFVSGLLFLGLACASFFLAYLSYQDFKSNNPAIVFAREIVVSSEPNDRSERVFTLHEGTKVNILEDLENWLKIEIADGQIGWTPSENLKLLRDF